MSTDELAVVDTKIKKLINEKEEYSFTILREKVEEILDTVNFFKVENKLDTKAVDLYLKTVITQRNNIKKEQEKSIIDNSKQTKYILIEEICKKFDFKTQEELIKKIEELEKLSNLELNEINKRS